MAGIVTFSPRTTLTTIRDEFRFSAARLNQHRWTADIAARFTAFEERLAAAEREGEELSMAQEECNAAGQFIDEELDDLVDLVTGVTGNRRGPGLYRELFGNKRVFDFKRPIMNEQLDAMKGWQDVLADRDDPVLTRVAQGLEQLIPRAEEIRAKQQSARARRVMFRETGTRFQVIGQFNALRKSTLGELSKLQHDNNRDSGWAESFFRSSRTSQEMTVLAVEQRMEAHAEEGAYLHRLHQELLARQEAAEESARLAEERARQAELTDKRAQLAALQAEITELEDES